MSRAHRMETILTRDFSPTSMELLDDSARHAGHAGAAPGGQTHYRLLIISSQFKGLSPVQRHQAIYSALEDEFRNGLHALSIDARIPMEEKP